MDDRKRRLLKAIKAMSGLRYSDWRTLNNIMEHLFTRKLSRCEYELLSTPIELDEIETAIQSLSERR